MVLVGKVNKEIVLRLQPPRPARGGPLRRRRLAVPRRPAQPRPAARTSASSGASSASTSACIEHVASDYIPVIASVGADREGNSYNVNADEAAGAVAGALGAYKVIFLTDVPGWLADPADPASLIGQASAERCARRSPTSQGGMRPKLEACVRGDRRAASAPPTSSTAASPHSLLLELFTDAGIGTKIEAGAMSLAELQELEREQRDRLLRAPCPSSSCAARARGCGTRRATSTSTSCAASR